LFSRNYCLPLYYEHATPENDKKTGKISSDTGSTLKKKTYSEELDLIMKQSHKPNLHKVVEIEKKSENDQKSENRKLPLVFTFTNLSKIRNGFQSNVDYHTKFKMCELNDIRSFNISEVESKLEGLVKQEEHEEPVCFTFVFATKDDIHFLNAIRDKLERVFQRRVEKDKNGTFQMLVIVTYMNSENMGLSPPIVNINLCSEGWDIQVLDNLFENNQYDCYTQKLCLSEKKFMEGNNYTETLDKKCQNMIEAEIKKAIKRLNYFDHSAVIFKILRDSVFYPTLMKVSSRDLYRQEAQNSQDDLIIDRVIKEVENCYKNKRLALDFTDSIENFLNKFQERSLEELVRLMVSGGLVDYLVKLSIFESITIEQKINTVLIPIVSSIKKIEWKGSRL
jgi:hypothetical protein